MRAFTLCVIMLRSCFDRASRMMRIDNNGLYGLGVRFGGDFGHDLW